MPNLGSTTQNMAVVTHPKFLRRIRDSRSSRRPLPTDFSRFSKEQVLWCFFFSKRENLLITLVLWYQRGRDFCSQSGHKLTCVMKVVELRPYVSSPRGREDVTSLREDLGNETVPEKRRVLCGRCPERIRTKIYPLTVMQAQCAMVGSDLGGARRLGGGGCPRDMPLRMGAPRRWGVRVEEETWRSQQFGVGGWSGCCSRTPPHGRRDAAGGWACLDSATSAQPPAQRFCGWRSSAHVSWQALASCIRRRMCFRPSPSPAPHFHTQRALPSLLRLGFLRALRPLGASLASLGRETLLLLLLYSRYRS